MMSWRWLLWLIPIYLIVLVITAPASLLERGAVQGLHPSSTSGTLWRGKANIQAELPTGGVLQLQEVSWRLSPWALFSGRAEVVLNIPSQNYIYDKLKLSASTDKAQLSGTLQGAMQPAIQHMKLPVPITIAGDWQLNIADFQVIDFQSGKICDTLEGSFNARNTEMRINQQWHALGDYVSTLACTTENGIAIEIDD